MGKGKEKVAKKTTRAQEQAEDEPEVHKLIKITVRLPEPEPTDFVQSIRLGTTSEEEAEQEDSAEPLERHPPKRGREQRAKEPAPPGGGTQQCYSVLWVNTFDSPTGIRIKDCGA